MTLICDDSFPVHIKQRSRGSLGLLDFGRGVAYLVRRDLARHRLIRSQDHLQTRQHLTFVKVFGIDEIVAHIIA